MSSPLLNEVPPRYRGVWSRTLLQTPDTLDDTTFVRWMQTPRWHADLRVPAGARGATDATPPMLALQQGFCGITSVDRQDGAETCAWHRQLDFQPPGPDPDIGRVVFESPDRLIETGIHRQYREVWERVPGSTGRFVALEAVPASADGARTLLLVAGRFAMRVRSRSTVFPQGATSLAALAQSRADGWQGLLDFEISFCLLEAGRLSVQRSTLPGLEGQSEACNIRRSGKREAVVSGPTGATRWNVLDWDADSAVIL
jgi:hypothetical protein